MACKIHGIRNCKLPSCVNQQTILCDTHFMENCPVCATPPKPLTSLADSQPQFFTTNPLAPTPPKLPPPITDEHATKVLTAAEVYAQARQDVATIAENVKNLKANLRFAMEKLAEARKTKIAARKALAVLTRGKEEEGET